MNREEEVCTKQMDISNAVEGMTSDLDLKLGEIFSMLLLEPKTARVILEVGYGILQLIGILDDDIIEFPFPDKDFGVGKLDKRAG